MKSHKTLLQFVEALPAVMGKRAFIFSTSGEGEIQRHATVKELLMNRGFSIVGDFSCKGWDSWGPLKLVGGTNKGRPNADDLEDARVFARGLKEKYTSSQCGYPFSCFHPNHRSVRASSHANRMSPQYCI